MKLSVKDERASKHPRSYSVFELSQYDIKQAYAESYFYERDLLSSDKQVLVTKIQYLQQENENIKSAYQTLALEKQQLEDEQKKEQNRYILTIYELKSIISGIDKEKTTLENQLYILNDKLSSLLSKSSVDDQGVSYTSNAWTKDKNEFLSIITKQNIKIDTLTSIIESNTHRYDTDIQLLTQKIKQKKDEIRQLKGLLSLQTENIDLGTLHSEHNLSLMAELETAGIISTFSRINTTQTDPNRIKETCTQVNDSLSENHRTDKLMKFLNEKKLSGYDRRNRRSQLNVRNREAFKIPDDVMVILKKNM